MTTAKFELDLEPMVARAVEAEVNKMIGNTSYGYGSGSTINKNLQALVEQAFINWRKEFQSTISNAMLQAANSPELLTLLAKQSVSPIANAVVGGMGSTFVALGRDLGNDQKFRYALLDHVRNSLIPKPVEPIPHSVRAALSQASFALRELLPNDPDAKMTVAMIKQAQADIKDAEWCEAQVKAVK